MPLFMGICGYFFSISIKKHSNYIHTKLAGRLKGLFFPMLAFGIIKLIIAVPFDKWGIKPYLLNVHGIWFLGDLALNTVLLILVYKYLNGNLKHDIKYFLILLPFTLIPTPERGGFGYGGQGLFMWFYFIAGFIIDKYFNKDTYHKAVKYTKYVLLAYLIIYVGYCFTPLAPIGFTLNYHEHSFITIMLADGFKILFGYIGSFALLGIIWNFSLKVKDGWLHRRAVNMGKYTLDIYLLNIIILEMLGGQHLYPWLRGNVFHENVLMNHGFIFELISTFLVACVVMEIIVLVSRVLDHFPIIAKFFFYRSVK